jgi:hypothetical protein
MPNGMVGRLIRELHKAYQSVGCFITSEGTNMGCNGMTRNEIG